MGNIPAKLQEPLTLFCISFHRVGFLACLNYLMYTWGLQTIGVLPFTLNAPRVPFSQAALLQTARRWISPESVSGFRSLFPLAFIFSRTAGCSAPRSLLPARLRSGALGREENRRILAGSGRSRAAPPPPRPASSRWLQSASLLRPAGRCRG